MACESDKCDKYGLHHDYKDGVEVRKCFACEKDEFVEIARKGKAGAFLYVPSNSSCPIATDGVPDQPERSKREDKYEIIHGSNECMASDCRPSKECDEYHKNSVIQINNGNEVYLMRCSEQSGNRLREVQ